MKKRSLAIGAVLALLLLLAGYWMFGTGQSAPTTPVAKAKQLESQMFQHMKNPDVLPDERAMHAREFAESMRSLTPEERQEFFEASQAEGKTIKLDGDGAKEVIRSFSTAEGEPIRITRGMLPEGAEMTVTKLGDGNQVMFMSSGIAGGGGRPSYGVNEQGQNQSVKQKMERIDRTSPEMRARMDEMGANGPVIMKLEIAK